MGLRTVSTGNDYRCPRLAHRPPTSICTYQMNSGRFVGQDPRDLVGDAIEWWEKQLDDIEREACRVLSLSVHAL